MENKKNIPTTSKNKKQKSQCKCVCKCKLRKMKMERMREERIEKEKREMEEKEKREKEEKEKKLKERYIYYSDTIKLKERYIYDSDTIRVDGLCICTLPCLHYVEFKQEQPKRIRIRMKGDDIYKHIQAENGTMPEHFKFYEEYIRKMEHPTPEEIEDERQKEEARKKQYEEQAKKAQELTKLIHDTKASSYIEKLKNKHNVVSSKEDTQKHPVVYDDYGDFSISPICLESYPCRHNVYFKNTNEHRQMSGVEIYKMFKERIMLDVCSPHFKYYKNYYKPF